MLARPSKAGALPMNAAAGGSRTGDTRRSKSASGSGTTMPTMQTTTSGGGGGEPSNYLDDLYQSWQEIEEVSV